MLWKKITKTFTIFFSLFGWLIAALPPFNIEIPNARAAVPSGVIVAWPSTNDTIPTGWSEVTTLSTYYLEGTTIDPSAVAGGNTTHTHTSPTHTHTGHTHTGTTGNGSSASVATTNAGTAGAANAHAHAVTVGASASNVAQSANLGTASNDPPYTTVIWIKSNGTTDIPVGAWAYFNATAPSGWSSQSAGRYLKGTTNGGNGGATGGTSNAHTHTDSGHTHTESAHTHTGTTNATASKVNTAAGSGYSTGGHTHSVSSSGVTATEQPGVGVLANADGQPPFYILNTIQNDNASASLPLNVIAMWDGTVDTIPAGWKLCDGNNSTPSLNDKFIKGASTDLEISSTGGALTHTHAASTAHSHTVDSHTNTFTVSGDTGSQVVNASKTGRSIIGYDHTHTLSITGGGTTGTGTITADANSVNDNRPPYKEIVYIQYQGVAISISLTTDGSVNFGTLSENTTQDNTASGVNDVEVVSVDSGTAKLSIKSTVFTQGGNTWTLGASNGTNQVKWEFASSTTNWLTFSSAGTDYTLESSVAAPNTRNIYLRLTTPSPSSWYTAFSASVTVTASAP
ncbi:MAG: hypothetical protein C3F02_01470 [Parcubacteria group bacterium]|nr:MAG: hypothetical protein C3F02_01470 [Parcubacteria group bacterium]